MLCRIIKSINILRSFCFFPILIFAALSAAPFFWNSADFNYHFIGADDFPAPISSLLSFHYSIYTFDHLIGAGFDRPFAIAMLPVYAFFFVMSWLGVSQLFSTIMLVSLQIFIAELAFFYGLKYFITNKLGLKNNYIAACVLGAIMYGFSPYMITIIMPGHMLVLFMYALFPLTIRYLDALLIADKQDYTAAILFVILAFCAPSFGNIGNLYVFFIATGMYALFATWANSRSLWRGGLRFTFFIVLALLSNFWWLAPHLYGITTYIANSHVLGGEMNNLVASASSAASIANIFLGKPEDIVYMFDYMKNDYFINAFHSLVFVVITTLAVYAAFNSQRYIHALLFTALCSIFFLKGVQAPFADLFLWAYDNIPGFQVLRRPTSKFYGFFLYFFLTTATFGLAIAINKIYAQKWQRLVLGFGSIAVGYMVIIFALTPCLRPYNIPERYFEARDYLMQNQVERVLILPVPSGWRPHYDSTLNFYTGFDFVDDFFIFPKIDPASGPLATNEGYFRPTNELIQQLRDNESICDVSRSLGISHILVRDDLVQSQVEDKSKRLEALLDQHQDITQKTSFSDRSGSHLIVYKLKAGCTKSLINLDGNFRAFDYELKSPGKIVLNIESLRGKAKLNFLNDYSPNWEIFNGDSNRLINTIEENKSSIARAYNHPDTIKLNLDEIGYLLKKPLFNNSHEVLAEYANTWSIDPEYLKSSVHNADITSNADGSVNVRLVLYYRSQAYLLLGIVVSFATLIGLFIMRILRRKKLIK